jgi:hypothetical protein
MELRGFRYNLNGFIVRFKCGQVFKCSQVFPPDTLREGQSEGGIPWR